MDFSRLVGGQDQSLNRQLAEQLLSNSLFRDAAIKAAKEANSSNNNNNPQTESASGLDNLLDQLSSALTQAAENAAAGEAAPANEGNAVASLLNHPAVQAALNSLDLETSLSVKVLLGQVPPDAAQKAVDLLTRLPASTVYKVQAVLKELDSDSLAKGVNFFQALFSDRNDTVFAQQDNRDNYLTSSNGQKVTGTDLNKFLQSAYYVLTAGYDIGKYLDHATNVLNKGDYDDFRRFLDVTDMMTYKNQNLDAFFSFGDKLLDESPNDYESNIFQAYTTVVYGGKVEDYIDIAKGLQTSDFEGRNNMVDLTRIIVDFYKAKGYTPLLFKTLAEEARAGGDVRAMMDEYMAMRGLEDTSPDFSRFDRIERIDGNPMVIKQGESAAVFAQAVSTVDGLLPESVLYWSSLETGALSHGSSYLDLSKLGPGTYHIACKIGNYPGGTDTAFKTVIIEPADGTTGSGEGDDDTTHQNTPVSEIILPEDGQVKITVKDGSAFLRSDLFMKLNLQNLQLVAQNAQNGANVTTQQSFKAGDKLDFSIKTFHPGGAYEHATDDGKGYVKIIQTSPTTWKVCFEDLEGSQADYDFNDVEVEIELIKAANSGSTGSTGSTDAQTEEEQEIPDVTTLPGGGSGSAGGTNSTETNTDAAEAAAQQAAAAAAQAEAERLAAKEAELKAAEDARARAAEEEARLAAARAAADAAAAEAARLAAEEAARAAAEEAARLAAEEAARAAAEAEAARIAAERAAAEAAAQAAWYANAYTKTEAIGITQKAIADLNASKPLSAVTAGLNDRYYAALDFQTRTGMDYAEMVGDVSNSRPQLKQLLTQFLKQLQTGQPSVTVPSTGNNPYA